MKDIREKTPEQIASDIYIKYNEKLTSGLMYIDADGIVNVDAVECAIISVELVLDVCKQENLPGDGMGCINNPTHIKLIEVLKILKSKL